MKKPTLSFGKDKLFKILQFTDMHLVGLDGRDASSFAMVEELLEVQEPDLVVYTGDIVGSGPRCVVFMDRINEIAEKTGVPYTFAFGNHESSNGIIGRALSDALEAYPLSLYERGSENLPGYGNYAVDIHSSAGHSWTLYHFFCNGREMYKNSKGKLVEAELHINHLQQRWLVDMQAEKRTGKDMNPALVFGHKPLPEHDDLWMYEGIYGERLIRGKKPFINTGFFSAMRQAGDVRGYFCGHDHACSYYGKLYDIMLGYGRHSGYHCLAALNFPRGGRMIVISEESGEIEKTYIAYHRGDTEAEQFTPPLYSRGQFYK